MISKNQIKLVRSLEKKKYRQEEGLFVAEGPKVVGDLLACHFRPRYIYLNQKGLTPNPSPKSLTPSPSPKSLTPSPSPKEMGVYADFADCVIDVTEEELRRLSFLQHPQQVLAVFELPAEYHSTPYSSLSLALDGIQDPGNLGTIIRVADWYGIDTIYCSADTADAWSPKVVQATMGSIARVHIIYCDLQQLLREASVPVYGTVLDGDNIYDLQLTQEGIIVMGNEGNGISEPIRQLLTHRLLIPQMRPGAESLNVAIATAIVCSEFCRINLKS
ncbi:MAG: RNA methyltransferase [Prevotella sp.]|nr:RNA methyltransferase [Prevotella sp.]